MSTKTRVPVIKGPNAVLLLNLVQEEGLPRVLGTLRAIEVRMSIEADQREDVYLHEAFADALEEALKEVRRVQEAAAD
jgi:hypothetical protein